MKKEIKHTEITRKEAIKKLGKYAAFTAVGTFAVLNPLRAQNTSTPINPGGPTAEQPSNPENDNSQQRSSSQAKRSTEKNSVGNSVFKAD